MVEPDEGAKEFTFTPCWMGRLFPGHISSSSNRWLAPPRPRSRRPSSSASRPSESAMPDHQHVLVWREQLPEVPDYRPEVHDSDGLLILDSYGTRIWRPLQTVTKDLVDVFALPKSPQGFGLLQRDREYSSSVDIRAIYHGVLPCGWSRSAIGTTDRSSSGRSRQSTNTTTISLRTGCPRLRPRPGKNTPSVTA